MDDLVAPPPHALQQSITTAIALVSDEASVIIAGMVDPGSFDQPFSDIVSTCIEYRKKYGEAPGKSHIDDLFADILDDNNHKQNKNYHRILKGMLDTVERINTKFLLDQVSEFTRLRQLRAAIADAAARYQKAGKGVVADIEKIFRDNLRTSGGMRDYGWTLAQPEALGFLDRDDRDFCKLGIPELDNLGVCPTRKEMLAFLAPRNKGKSQFLGLCGKAGIQKGWVVAHYTLENSDDMTAQRYYQSLFNGAKREGSYHYVDFLEDEDNHVELRPINLVPDFLIENQDHARKYLKEKVKDPWWQNKLKNLRIRRFPTSQLSFEMLERDLDELAVVHKFVPDMVLIDYPQIMKLGKHEKDYTALDELIAKLRGLAVERNFAIVVPQQGNRASESVDNVQSQHGGGSMGIAAVADNMITYSQTKFEEAHGIARLYLQKVRNDSARTTVFISQHYATGQFVMRSRFMSSTVQKAVTLYTKGTETEETGLDSDDGKKQKTLPRRRNGDARHTD